MIDHYKKNLILLRLYSSKIATFRTEHNNNRKEYARSLEDNVLRLQWSKGKGFD